MNTLRFHILLRTLGKLMLLPLAGILFAACGVTEPDTSAWQSADSYSWPIGNGKRELTFRNEMIDSASVRTDTLVFDMEPMATEEREFGGRAMYKLDWQQRSTNYYFLPLRDTLVILDQVPATLALITPLVQKNSWICEFDAVDSTPTWRATIVERYSYRNVEGTIYKNVIEVEYEPLTKKDIDKGNSWVRFFAEGVGPVQTIKLFNTFSHNASLPDKSEPVERRILIKNVEATN